MPFHFLIEKEYPLVKVLTEGRILSSARHDTSNPEVHTHWHRRILRTYNLATGLVLLSHQASANCPENLGVQDREYTPAEINRSDWSVRPADYEIF